MRKGQCQYPDPGSPLRCRRDVAFRVQIGACAGAWWVCEEHVGPVVAKAGGLGVNIAEGMDHKKMSFKCRLIQQDVPTVNGHVYSKEALEKVAGDTNNLAVKGRCFVTYGYPDSFCLKLSDVIGRVDTCRLIEGQLEVDIKMLETPAARKIDKEMLRGVTASPFTMGTVKSDGKVDVNDIKLICWSLVEPKK